MSNLLTPLDLRILEAVTGGASTASTPRCATGTGTTPDLLQTLNSLSTTIKDIGNTASKTGFSTTEVLMLGLLLNQQRSSSVVFVRRPYW